MLARPALKFGLALLAALLLAAAAPPPPAGEDGVPYHLRMVADGTVLEITGSFVPPLAADFEAMVNRQPGLRAVRLESPGGRVAVGWQLADIIQHRGLSTYTGRLCASACTLAFLGGRQRWLAPDARLGFHQGRSPDGPSDAVNKVLGQAYAKLGLPADFVARILATPPTGLWVPTLAELRAAHVVTTDPPASMLALGGGPAPKFSDVGLMLRTAPDDALIQFATSWSDALYHLQASNPAACYAFAHDGQSRALDALPRAGLEDFIAALKYLAEASRYQQVPPMTADQRATATRELMARMRATGQGATLAALQPDADHAAFCPALRDLLAAALAERRTTALRALLSG
jgi:hypothetical protein